MKKVGPLLLAMCMILSMGIGAFAAEDIPPAVGFGNAAGDTGNGVTGFNNVAGDTGNGNGTAIGRTIAFNDAGNDDTIYLPEPGDATDTTTQISPRINWNTGTANTIDIEAGEMFLVDTTTRLIVLPETRLDPGSEYEFQIFTTTAGETAFNINTVVPAEGLGTISPLIEADITTTAFPNGRLRLRSGKGGNVIQDTELKLRGTGANRRYYLSVETKDVYNTKLTDVTYTLLTSGAVATATSLMQSGISFQVGHARMPDDEIDSYDEGDTITVTNTTPVFLKKQIERLVKRYNYKAIELEFEDGSWRYTGRMSGMSDTNFYTTQEVIPSIMNKFDQDFKFLILPAGVTFPTNGEMRIDVSDVSEDWDRIYTYLYRNGMLTRINTTYDPVDDMIYFRTNFLGAFVMTDVEITDVNILEPDASQPGVSEPTQPTTPTTPHNPPTGIPVGMNLIFGLGAFSLLTASTVIIRKKK